MLSFASAAEREELIEQLTTALTRHRYEALREGLARTPLLPPLGSWETWGELSEGTKQMFTKHARADAEFVVSYLERHQDAVGEMSHTEETNPEEARNV